MAKHARNENSHSDHLYDPVDTGGGDLLAFLQEDSPASHVKHHAGIVHNQPQHHHAQHHEANEHGVGNLFSSAFLHADALFFVHIDPLNNSGVRGEAVLALNGNILTVEIAATGLDPAFNDATGMNQVHPLHIHGFPGGNPDSKVPTLASDADHDGFIEVAEGAPDYGPILLSLTHNGQFPTAPNGTFIFTQTYQLPSAAIPSPIQALNELGLNTDVPLDRREIVIHGLTLQAGQGATNADSIVPPIGLNEADGTPGYKAALPVAAGEIQDSHGNSALAQFVNGLDALGIHSHDWHI